MFKGNKNIFSSIKFSQFLQDKSIEHLYLVGLATDYCIKISAQKAISRGYKVTVVSNAVAAYKCEDFSKSLQVLASNNIAVIESADLN